MKELSDSLYYGSNDEAMNEVARWRRKWYAEWCRQYDERRGLEEKKEQKEKEERREERREEKKKNKSVVENRRGKKNVVFREKEANVYIWSKWVFSKRNLENCSRKRKYYVLRIRGEKGLVVSQTNCLSTSKLQRPKLSCKGSNFQYIRTLGKSFTRNCLSDGCGALWLPCG